MPSANQVFAAKQEKKEKLITYINNGYFTFHGLHPNNLLFQTCIEYLPSNEMLFAARRLAHNIIRAPMHIKNLFIISAGLREDMDNHFFRG